MDNRNLSAGKQFKRSRLQVEEDVYRTESLTLFKSFYTSWALEHFLMALEHNPWMGGGVFCIQAHGKHKHSQKEKSASFKQQEFD